MNEREIRMVEILRDLHENHNVFAVKAEFEAEGARLEEVLRLKEIVTRAGLELTIKIGGCEAVKDVYDARSIGVSMIIAPMIETSYAMKKYLMSAKMAFSEFERKNMKFLINVETIQGVKNFDEMLASEYINDLDGIVIGRVDLTGSMGLDRDDINCEEVFNIVNDVFFKAKKKGLICGIGGGVAKESLPFFKKLPDNTPDYYETRKVLFSCPGALDARAPEGILKAVGFELMWLKNKRDFYGSIYREDDTRLDMLETRYKKMIKEVGGYVS